MVGTVYSVMWKQGPTYAVEVTGPDIFRAAKLLIEQHGPDAGLRAAERAVTCSRLGTWSTPRPGRESWLPSRS
jgi:hypothetical protein